MKCVYIQFPLHVHHICVSNLYPEENILDVLSVVQILFSRVYFRNCYILRVSCMFFWKNVLLYNIISTVLSSTLSINSRIVSICIILWLISSYGCCNNILQFCFINISRVAYILFWNTKKKTNVETIKRRRDMSFFVCRKK